jgi:hypothetical protein
MQSWGRDSTKRENMLKGSSKKENLIRLFEEKKDYVVISS